jgi:EmrB/QacA subfamily drug resistance transporter
MSAALRSPCEEGLIRGTAAEAQPLSAGRRRLILIATILGSSLAWIDATVVNVALPAMQRALGADPAEAQWVMTAYLLTLGALLLVGGAAGDLYGRRRIFLAGVAVFTLASAACGLAPNASLLVLARAVQGAGAALLTPASLAILGASFPDADRGRAIGAWAGFGAVTSAIGPLLGGWFVDHVSWRAIFFINIPIALVCAALTLKVVPESRDPAAKSLDIPGAALVAVGLGLLSWALARAPELGFGADEVWGALAASAVALAAFLVRELTAREPMVPFGLFRSLDFTGANLLTLFLYFAFGGAFFFVPFELIRVGGYSATAAGAALLPMPLVMGALSPAAGRLGDRIGPRRPLTFGPLIAALGLFLLARASPTDSYWTGFFPAAMVLAAGMTLAVAPLTTTVMGAVERAHVGTASGVNNAIARVAGLLAVAALSVLFASGFDEALDRALDNSPVAASPARPARGSALAVQPRAAEPRLRKAETAAFSEAYREAMLAASAAAAAAGVAGFLLIGRGRSPGSASSGR